MPTLLEEELPGLGFLATLAQSERNSWALDHRLRLPCRKLSPRYSRSKTDLHTRCMLVSGQFLFLLGPKARMLSRDPVDTCWISSDLARPCTFQEETICQVCGRARGHDPKECDAWNWHFRCRGIMIPQRVASHVSHMKSNMSHWFLNVPIHRGIRFGIIIFRYERRLREIRSWNDEAREHIREMNIMQTWDHLYKTWCLGDIR